MLATVLSWRGYSVVADIRDGNAVLVADRITEWSHPTDPQPTQDQLAEWEAAPEYTAWLLEQAKRRKMAAIDARSEELVTAGLTVAPEVTVSTSLAATQNLQDLTIGYQLGMTVFPQAVSTIDGGEYEIPDAADLARIAGLVKQHKTSILDAGRNLRAQVLAATTIDELHAVEDTR